MAMWALVKCAKCSARKFEVEVKYSSEHKDFICKDISSCERPKDINQMRREPYKRRQPEKDGN